ncbi:2-hydroxychromene-2-carboxylate isomerase [Aquisalimonas sp.]|uniref:2-hydroxychromene-2-carboxylate isomerase n=1 Tax=unclassified Aquisalimonas TaxID=2644645 RepID=UPI0025BA4A88|nr:2-hydroxychromene-2-carboxylate isomerase [Aquisalimonas sp.]
MTRQVEFFFDFVSTASYLAWTQLPRVTRDTGAEIVWRPMLLGAVIKAAGNTPPPAIPAKGKYLRRDFARWARRYGVELNFPSRHPVNTVTTMRGAVAYIDSPVFPAYLKSVFEGFWIHDQDIEDPEVIARLVEQAGIDPEEFHAAIERQDVKDRLRANTDEAVERGAFGAPTLFVGDEMFFGQDRLDFVIEALGRA